MIVSVIDTSAPDEVPELVVALESSGYARFWGTEHYSPTQTSSPSIIATVAAGLTRQMRIGVAAYLLSYTSPARIVADARLLAHLFGDRFDVGVARASVPSAVEALLLDGRPAPSSSSFDERFRLLADLLRPGSRAELGPRADLAPPLWLCGQSEASAVLAGTHSASFAFHDYLNALSPRPVDGPTVVERYRSIAKRGHVAVACYGACAGDEQEARTTWARVMQNVPNVPAPSFVGAPAGCAERIRAIAERYRADEVIIQVLDHVAERRIESYTALAAALGLAPSDHAGT